MLIVLNATPVPTSFDVKDSEMGTFLGGEVVTLAAAGNRLIVNDLYHAPDPAATPPVVGTPNLAPFILNPAYDSVAFDAEANLTVGGAAAAGFTAGTATAIGQRAYVSKAAVTASSRSTYLVDNGSVGYGTQFGSWTGGVAGQKLASTSVGPTTDQTSGKVCLYRRGLFGVTVDALAADLQPPPGNGSAEDAAWTSGGGVLAPGATIYAIVGTANAGKLTSVLTNNLAVGTFVAYETKMGYVRTPTPFNPKTPYANIYMMVFEFQGA